MNNNEFIPDNETTERGKNLILSQHLTGSWNNYKIIAIVRIEGTSPGDSGWQVIFT
jgi:hypothetical protein